MQKAGSDPLIGEGVWELFGGLGREPKSLSKTAACNLREYSMSRSRLKAEKHPTSKSYTLERIDLAGGNGRWRQRQAKVEFAQRDIEEAELRRQAKMLEKERRRRKEEKQREREAREKEDLEKRKREREKALQETLEREKERLAAEEAEYVRQRQEQLEWQRRQPKMCEDCQGSGKCQACDGLGYSFAMFLVPEISYCTKLEHGKVMQGCAECGGLPHNIVGDLRLGTGKCIPCNGVGKITPVVTSTKSSHRRRYTSAISANSTAGEAASGPNSPLLSPSASRSVW